MKRNKTSAPSRLGKEPLNDEEREYLHEIYLRYSAYIFRKMRELAENRMDAEDMIQECMVRLMKYRKTLMSLAPGQQTSYILRTITSVQNDYLFTCAKKEKWFSGAEVSEFLSDDRIEIDPGRFIENKEETARFTAAFQNLQPRDRLLLSCRFDENMPVAEIAGRLGISIDAARQAVHRAQKRLLGEMEKGV